ncbi:MAG: CoA pyrophosphatase [Propionibacteriaceae bacterium]|nr:CoA pyrophosphatase [Propionibacteriaceae bacterium]
MSVGDNRFQIHGAAMVQASLANTGDISQTQPTWLGPLLTRLDPLDAAWPPVAGDQRGSAVIALLGLSEDPDLVLTVRSAELEHHGGQISLPGGGREPGDAAPCDTALREAQEEIGLPRTLVTPVGQMHTHEISVSNNWVIPVVGVWSGAEPVAPKDTEEVDCVLRWSLSQLADPAHRVMARHPRGGRGPAWDMGELFLWGFTAWVVDSLLRLGGWEQPWDHNRLAEIPARFMGKHPLDH